MKKGEIRRLVLSAVLVALGVVLARLFHALGGWQAGSIFLPMHITVLLCGLLCGWKYGMLCGMLTPLTAMLVSGMPTGATLISMMLELGAYGVTAGFLYRMPLAKKSPLLKVVIALVLAMLAGRAVYGIFGALTSTGGDNAFGWTAFLSGAFIKAWPGILIQLVLLPTLMMVLRKGKWGEGL